MTSTPLQSNAAVIEALRHHSSKIVDATSTWIDALDSSGLVDIKSFAKDWNGHLSAISIEASYLGFCTTVRLAHTISACINSSVCEKSLEKAQAALLLKALVNLKALVCNPGHLPADTRQILLDLQTHFGIHETDLTEPFAGRMDASPLDLTTTLEQERSLAHRDLDVYRNARLDSLDHCREEETWIVSQLAALAEDLASGIHSAHPAIRLMHVLKGHKFFNHVDRVCLAGRVAHGNQLVVIDASISERCVENSLKKGYSCFVNPEGSLFKMRPGTVRIFANSDRVLTSFVQQQKPAQRSIALIADQGLRSGLCLAIGRGDSIQGFLFLNSLKNDLFQDITVQFAPLLSLFGLVATIALDTNGFHLTRSDAGPYTDWLPKTAIRFDQQEFLALVKRGIAMLRGPDSDVHLTMEKSASVTEFLYLPTTVVATVADLVVRTRVAEKNANKLHLQVAQERGEIRVEFQHHCNTSDTAVSDWLNHTVRSIGSRFANKPIKVRLDEKHIAVSFPYEPLLFGADQPLYSTVY